VDPIFDVDPRYIAKRGPAEESSETRWGNTFEKTCSNSPEEVEFPVTAVEGQERPRYGQYRSGSLKPHVKAFSFSINKPYKLLNLFKSFMMTVR